MNYLKSFKMNSLLFFTNGTLFGWELFVIFLATWGQRLPGRYLSKFEPQTFRFPTSYTDYIPKNGIKF